MKKLAITLFGLSTLFGTSAMAAEQAQQQAQAGTPQQAAASYQCAQDQSVVVNYAVDEQGQPALAVFEHDGDVKQLQFNASKSDQSSVAFTSQDGYNLSASAPSDNTLFAQTVDITGPNSEAVYQDCQATTGS